MASLFSEGGRNLRSPTGGRVYGIRVYKEKRPPETQKQRGLRMSSLCSDGGRNLRSPTGGRVNGIRMYDKKRPPEHTETERFTNVVLVLRRGQEPPLPQGRQGERDPRVGREKPSWNTQKQRGLRMSSLFSDGGRNLLSLTGGRAYGIHVYDEKRPPETQKQRGLNVVFVLRGGQEPPLPHGRLSVQDPSVRREMPSWNTQKQRCLRMSSLFSDWGRNLLSTTGGRAYGIRVYEEKRPPETQKQRYMNVVFVLRRGQELPLPQGRQGVRDPRVGRETPSWTHRNRQVYECRLCSHLKRGCWYVFCARQSRYISRVPQCLSPRQNWDPPTPLPQARVPPPNQREGTLACRWGGGGVSISDDWRKSLALCLLCDVCTE